MKANTKEWIQYGAALIMLLSGVILTFLCFFLNNYEVKDSVLWYVAQTLVYSGSIYGVAMFIHTKFGEVKNYIDGEINSKK